MGISINILLHCSVLGNPSSAFSFSSNVGTKLSTPVRSVLNGDHFVNLEELKTCRDVPVCIDYPAFCIQLPTHALPGNATS